MGEARPLEVTSTGRAVQRADWKVGEGGLPAVGMWRPRRGVAQSGSVVAGWALSNGPAMAPKPLLSRGGTMAGGGRGESARGGHLGCVGHDFVFGRPR